MSTHTLASPPVVGAPPLARERQSAITTWPVWGVYLFLAACLVPVLQPVGPFQLAIVDGLNMLAILVFFGVALATRRHVNVPLLVPAMIIAAGSMVALTNALSMKQAAITMIQDVYLYVWFVFLVNIMRARGGLRGFRIGWVWVGTIMSVVGLVMLLSRTGQPFWTIFAAKGDRAVGLFYGPNTFADYLAISVFVALSLSGQVRRLWLWPAIVIMLLGLVGTKSNGAMGGLLAGLVAWGVVRLYTRSGKRVSVVAGTLVLAGLCAIGWWAFSETKLGLTPGEASVARQSFLGRVDRSSRSRAQIWDRLLHTLEHAPLGIGAGNSKEQQLGVATRERRTSYQSKEAHNDYLAYAIERGPLGFVGLLLLIGASFAAIGVGWKSGNSLMWQAGMGGAIAAAMVGGLLASSIHSLVMERLHFRHFWLFMALLWAFRAPSADPGARAARTNGKVSATGLLRRQIRLGSREPLHHN